MKLLIQLVRVLHLSGKSQRISETSGYGNHVKTRKSPLRFLKSSYKCLSFQSMSPVHHFNTSPPVGSEDKFTALVYGDMGVSPVPRAYKTAEYATREALSGNAAFVFHNGDISYARGYVSEFNCVLFIPQRCDSWKINNVLLLLFLLLLLSSLLLLLLLLKRFELLESFLLPQSNYYKTCTM